MPAISWRLTVVGLVAVRRAPKGYLGIGRGFLPPQSVCGNRRPAARTPVCLETLRLVLTAGVANQTRSLGRVDDVIGRAIAAELRVDLALRGAREVV